jgi:microcystin-dependent protein
MGAHRNFDDRDKLFASWTDAIQEFISTLVVNLKLTQLSTRSIRAAASADEGQVSIGFAGPWRYRTSNYDLTISGSAGTQDIYAVAVTANDFAGAGNDPDETDYNWELRAVASGTRPTSVAHFRKVGEVDWNGSAITDIRQTINNVNGPMVENLSLGVPKLTAEAQQYLVPTGAILPFFGAVAPAGFLMCDFSEHVRATYTRLFGVIGTTGGPGNGSTTFNTPDLRGRAIVGVDGAAGRLSANDTLGASGGRETHTLSTAELPSHTHADGSLATSNVRTGITITGAGTGISVNGVGDHAHSVNINYFAGGANQVALGSYLPSLVIGGAQVGTFGGGAHSHSINDPGHTHGITDPAHGHDVTGATSATGSGTAHNNMQPYLVVNYIIKT